MNQWLNNGITLPIMRRTFVAGIVLATVFSVAWCKIVMQRISPFLFIHTHLKACVYTEKSTVIRVIFHGIPLESVA